MALSPTRVKTDADVEKVCAPWRQFTSRAAVVIGRALEKAPQGGVGRLPKPAHEPAKSGYDAKAQHVSVKYSDAELWDRYSTSCTKVSYAGLNQGEFHRLVGCMRNTEPHQLKSLITALCAVTTGEGSVKASDITLALSGATNSLRLAEAKAGAKSVPSSSAGSQAFDHQKYLQAIGDAFKQDVLATHKSMSASAREDPTDTVAAGVARFGKRVGLDQLPEFSFSAGIARSESGADSRPAGVQSVTSVDPLDEGSDEPATNLARVFKLLGGRAPLLELGCFMTTIQTETCTHMLASLLAVELTKVAFFKDAIAWPGQEGLSMVAMLKISDLRVPLGYFSSDSVQIELSAAVTTTGEGRTTGLEWYVLTAVTTEVWSWRCVESVKSYEISWKR